MHVDSPIKHDTPIQRADYEFLGRRDPDAQGQHPVADDAAFPRRPRSDQRERLSRARSFYDDLARPIAPRSPTSPRRLPLPATRRHQPRLSLRSRRSASARKPAATIPSAGPSLCKLVNDAIRDRPKDMTISVHLCRGNFKSAWVAKGGYEPVAEILLNEMKSTATSSNTTTNAPAISRRCASCPRARRSCSG